MTVFGYNCGVIGKIAIITERLDPSLGGAERSVGELAEAVSKLGPEVHILAAKGTATGPNVHILCRDTPGKRTSLSRLQRAARRHLQDNHYDVIHSVLPLDFADVYQPRGGAYPEAMQRNAASYHGNFLRCWKRWTAFANCRRTVLWCREKKLCRNRHGPVVAALSGYVAEQFKRHYGLDDSRVVVVPNGVKVRGKPDETAAGALRREITGRLGTAEPGRTVLMLFVANNFRLKGLRPLLMAIKAAGESVERQVSLIVVGSDNSAPYRRLAERLNIMKNVLFPGAMDDIGTVLGACDVAVLPSFYDPCSRFTLEALAANKPVITTRHNGATDLFKDGRHGRVIGSADDVSALAEAIAYFSNAANVKKAADAIAADNLREEISIDRHATRLLELYRELKGKRR